VSRLSDLLDAGPEERTQPISQRKIVTGNSSMMIIRLRIRMSLCVIGSCLLVFLLNLLTVFVTMPVRWLLVTSFHLKAQEPGGKDLFVLAILSR
jgi:hypothetical protein